MAAVTENRNLFNCPLLLKNKPKLAQIVTAATWHILTYTKAAMDN
jgi:hypothetical protein